MKPTVLILAGDGINCEEATENAFVSHGFRCRTVLINELSSKKYLLNDSQCLALPGGFSFGDELGSGQILALKIKSKLFHELSDFVAKKKPIIGICNGMQALAKLDLLPFPLLEENNLSMAANIQGHFINKWVQIEMNESECHWVKWAGPSYLELARNYPYLPIRHGEGRYLFKDQQVLKKIEDQKLVVARYVIDQNGSQNKIAALTDPSGLILGMMPHPEAALDLTLFPMTKSFGPGPGHLFFNSIKNFLKQ